MKNESVSINRCGTLMLNICFVHNNYMNSETQDKQELCYSQVLRTIAFTSLNSEFINLFK